MNHPTAKVVGTAEQNAANKVADEVSKHSHVSRAYMLPDKETHMPVIWVVLKNYEGANGVKCFTPSMSADMFERGYVMDYYNGTDTLTFVRIADMGDN